MSNLIYDQYLNYTSTFLESKIAEVVINYE